MTSPIKRANEHLIRNWHLATKLYRDGHQHLAAFLSITLIEEVGKFSLFSDKRIGKKFNKREFLNHRAKYRAAVWNTLYVNSRVSRLYGKLESRFAKWFCNDELFKIRNQCLYIEQKNGEPRLPPEMVSLNDCFLLLCISGEVLAEIQGEFTDTGTEQWSAMLQQVDEFREAGVRQ